MTKKPSLNIALLSCHCITTKCISLLFQKVFKLLKIAYSYSKISLNRDLLYVTVGLFHSACLIFPFLLVLYD